MKGDYPIPQLVRVRWVLHGRQRGAEFIARVTAENDDDAWDIGLALCRVFIPQHARAWIWVQTVALGREATGADMKAARLPWETLEKWEANAPMQRRAIAGRK